MKILLCTPPQEAHSIMPKRYQSLHRILKKLGGNKPILGIQPPYGLMYIASYLKKDRHEVFIIDGLLTNLDHMLEIVQAEKIDIVGISSVSWNWSKTKNFAKILKLAKPQLRIAVGGAHVNSVREKALLDCAYIDYAFYGDGEEVFSQVVSMLSAGIKPHPIDGFSYRDGDKIIASERNAFIKNIDSVLLPDRDSLGIMNYRPSPLSYRKEPFTAMFGSRGCPYGCTFCHTEKKVRIRSAANLISEIQWLQNKYGIKEILFFDDTFTLHKDRVYEFCGLLIKNNIRLSWSASVRADSVNKKMLMTMKKAGCWRLLIGIETGSQRLLDRIKKGVTLQQITEAVNMIHETGIHTFGMFMFGIPTETYDEGLETVKFMKKLKLDYVSVCNVTPFPGTEIYNEVSGEPGFKGLDYMNMFDIAYTPKTMKEKQLQDLLKRSMREFYFRLPYILRQIKNIRSLTDITRYIRGLLIVFLR